MTFPVGVWTVMQASWSGFVMKTSAHVPDPSNAPSIRTPTPTATMTGSHGNLRMMKLLSCCREPRRPILC